MATKTFHRFTIELADGQVFQAVRPDVPRAWKSWIQRQVPRSADLFGATFRREQVELDYTTPALCFCREHCGATEARPCRGRKS